MRPHIRTHHTPDAFLNYMLRPGSKPLGGTVPIRKNKEVIRRFQDFGSGNDGPKPFRHVTMSLPKGLVAARRLWLRIAKTAIKKLGLDPDRMPWIAVRHTDSVCDHIHIAICLRDVFGRTHRITSAKKRCEDVHVHLSEMLGLDPPAYFDATALPRLDPITPARRLTSAHVKSLHADLRHVFTHRQPETLEELDQALSERPGQFRATFTPNKARTPSFCFTNAQGAIRGGTLGCAWRPKATQARLTAAFTLRRCRYKLELDQLVGIFRTREMEKLLDHLFVATHRARTAARPADHPRSDQDDGQPCPGPARAVGSSEQAGRPAGVVGRDAGGLAEKPGGDPVALPGAVGKDVLANRRDAAADQRGGRRGPGTAAASGQETGSHSLPAGHAHRLTLGWLLAQVCHIAAARNPGWRLKMFPKSRRIGIAFRDRSAAIVSATSAAIVKDGSEARMFEADYAAATGPSETFDNEGGDHDPSGPAL